MGAELDFQSDEENSSEGLELLKNVLLVRKTPKYERLKDSELIKHPYI